MNISSILAITDLSPQENHALGRAASLAAAHRARLKLMYAAQQGAAWRPDVSRGLAEIARQLEERFAIPVATARVRQGALERLVRTVPGIDLVVLPHRRECSPGAFLRGQPALRVLRASDVPVLIARLDSDRAYRRILVGVDLTSTSQHLAGYASRFDESCELSLLHVIGTRDEARLRSADASERADLVVVGKSAASVWRDFLCGSVAERALRWTASDVLGVPHAYLAAMRAGSHHSRAALVA